MTANELDAILERVNQKNLPPVELWNPEYSGELDMRIAVDGSWHYQGSVISRKTMVNLFSTILRVEDGQHYLVTPLEKFRIVVDDAAFVATGVEKFEGESQMLVFTTNVGEQIIADSDHRIVVHTDEVSGHPRPYLQVRNGLMALISRNVFYELVEWARPAVVDCVAHLVIESRGQIFSLGRL